MKVIQYNAMSPDELSPLFVDYSFGRYCSDRKLNIEAARRLEADRLVVSLQKHASRNWAAMDGSRIMGVLCMRESHWDSEFWGQKTSEWGQLISCGSEDERERTASALVGQGDAWCCEAGVKFAFARADAMDLASIQALEKHGFRYIETTLINSLDLRWRDPCTQLDGLIRLARADETDGLMDMVKDAFVTHRFYADRGFALERVEEMYRAWVRQNLESEMWTTIVLEMEGRARGLFTYRLEDLSDYFGLRFVKWRMAALASDDRGRGIGEHLFRGAMEFVRNQADIVDSGLTMRNIRSLNLHNRLGFRALCTAVTLHKWYT